MKPTLFLLFAFSFLGSALLAGQQVLAPAAAQNTTQFSTATLVVDIGSRNEITMHISSPQGYEVLRFADRNSIRNNPARYRRWTAANIASRYDFTIVHQQIDSLQARGWQLINSSVSSAVDYSDLNTIYQKELYFQFRIPAALPIEIQDPDQYVLVVQAKVPSDDLSGLRGRVIQMKDNSYQLIVERRQGLAWEVVYQLDNEGPVAADLGKNITGFTLETNRLSLEYTMPEGTYDYQFWGQPGVYLLREVHFVASNPCGLAGFSVDFAAYPNAKFVGSERDEPCLPGSPAKTFREKLDRQEIRLRNLFPGTNSIELDKAGKTVDF